MTRLLNGLLLGVLLPGCVSVGTPVAVNERAISHLASSQYQMRDVLRLLGTPTGAGRPAKADQADRTPIHAWTYDYTHVDLTPATYIPLLGPFLGASPVTTGSLTVWFDAPGTLRGVQQAPRFDDIPGPPFAWPDRPPF